MTIQWLRFGDSEEVRMNPAASVEGPPVHHAILIQSRHIGFAMFENPCSAHVAMSAADGLSMASWAAIGFFEQ